MGGGNSESRNRGLPSENGKLKTAIAYHGSFSKFQSFDSGAIGDKSQVNQYGGGFYFTDNPQIARNYGDNVYKVEIRYSTDMRTAKRTGRDKDFQYDPKTGFWVIPYSKQKNIRILRRIAVN